MHRPFLQQVRYFGFPPGLAVSTELVAKAAYVLARRRLSLFAAVIGYVVMAQLVIFPFQASFEGTVLRVVFYTSVGLAVALSIPSNPSGSREVPPHDLRHHTVRTGRA